MCSFKIFWIHKKLLNHDWKKKFIVAENHSVQYMKNFDALLEVDQCVHDQSCPCNVMLSMFRASEAPCKRCWNKEFAQNTTYFTGVAILPSCNYDNEWYVSPYWNVFERFRWNNICFRAHTANHMFFLHGVIVAFSPKDLPVAMTFRAPYALLPSADLKQTICTPLYVLLLSSICASCAWYSFVKERSAWLWCCLNIGTGDRCHFAL